MTVIFFPIIVSLKSNSLSGQSIINFIPPGNMEMKFHLKSDTQKLPYIIFTYSHKPPILGKCDQKKIKIR